jgi:tetratricopeptide (TPR) repeat protein
LFLLDYWPLDRFKKQGFTTLVLEKVPLLFLSMAAGIATLIAQKSTVGYGEQTPLLARLGNASIACVTYIGQMFWPAKLAAFYPQPTNGWSRTDILLAGALLAIITILSMRFRKSRPYLIVGWLWYLISLSLTLGLIPVGLQAHADRYTYLPQIGLYIALTWLVGDLAKRFPATRPAWVFAGFAAVGTSTWLSSAQASSWRNTETLWEHALAVMPHNDVANYNLALLALDRGRLDDAIRYLENALAGRSDREASSNVSTALLHNTLGIALAREGRPQDAIAHYRKAIELRDDYADAHTNLASILFEKGDTAEAIEHFRKAKSLPPEDARSHLRLAIALDRTGQTAEAMSEYRRALALAPSNARAHYHLAMALERAGNRVEARIEVARALELDPSQPEFKALQEQLNQK